MRTSRRCTTAVFIATLLSLAGPAMAQFDPILTLEGSCPGMLRAEVSQRRPGKVASLLFASETGGVRVPHNFCFGTQLGLGRRNLHEVDSQRLDRFGRASFAGMAGSRACGGYLQILVTSCETSNVVRVE